MPELASESEGWADAELEPQKGEEEPLVKPAAWKRVCVEKERELAILVEQGVLVGGRKGRRLTVQAGSFYDRLGEPVPVFPDWGVRFKVLPDKRADEVRRLRQAREAAKEALTHVPLSLGLDLVGRKLGHSPKDSTRANEIAAAVGTTLREGIQMRGRELLEVEQVLQEIAEEFDGEDPARPQERRALTEGKEKLRELHQQAQEYMGPFDPARSGRSRDGADEGGDTTGWGRLGRPAPLTTGRIYQAAWSIWSSRSVSPSPMAT